MRFFAPQKNINVLERLALYSDEIKYLMEKLIKQNEWITYLEDSENFVDVQIIELGVKRYFAVVDCENLCGIPDKQALIKSAVEFAIKEYNLNIDYKDIGVGGLAGDEGRKGLLYRLVKQTPPAQHTYAVFKTPGEEHAYIEDPRTGVFERKERLQSRTDDQVCCFAASALFYLSFKAMLSGNDKRSTPELFSELYKSTQLRSTIQKLENLVGKKGPTLLQVINHFALELELFKNPLTLTPPRPKVMSYAEVVNESMSMTVA